jgi:hypothetical protein
LGFIYHGDLKPSRGTGFAGGNSIDDTWSIDYYSWLVYTPHDTQNPRPASLGAQPALLTVLSELTPTAAGPEEERRHLNTDRGIVEMFAHSGPTLFLKLLFWMA